MTTAQILTPTALLTRATPFIDAANNLIEQANAAVVDSPETDARAADAVKICNAQLAKLEDARKSLVGPLNQHVKWINAEFKKVSESIAQAKGVFSKKALDYKLEQERLRREEDERLRNLAEEQALQEAAAAHDAGDDQRAEALLDMASSTPEQDTRVVARGDLTGASSSVRRDWKGRVVNVRALCRAIADGHVPEDVIKDFYRSKLDDFAKKLGVEKTVYGIEVTHMPSLNTR